MKIKYFILSIFTFFLGITSFVSATNYTINCPADVDTDCTPKPAISFSSSVNDFCFDLISSSDNSLHTLGYYYYNGDLGGYAELDNGKFCFPGNFTNLYLTSAGYDTNINIVLSDGNNEGGGNTGGNEGEENTGSNIIEGGISAFSGIITRLGNIFGEFGPYIIYIAIACIGISLLFKALKYILGFTNNQSKNSIGGRAGMKERRRRRRQQRRKTYTFEQAYDDNGRSYYYSKPYSNKYYRRSRKTNNGFIKNGF